MFPGAPVPRLCARYASSHAQRALAPAFRDHAWTWIQRRGLHATLAAAACTASPLIAQRPAFARDMRTSGSQSDAAALDQVDHVSAKLADISTDDDEDVDVVTGKQLQLKSGGFMIPHPAKAEKGGEDSFFIATTDRVFGVADGVSGWASVGVDPADFARQLMRCTRAICERGAAVKNAVLDPQRILEEAYEQSKHIVGSSTACIACINGCKLHAANLGDSGFMVVRNASLVFESPSQQHSFNFPYQIGSRGDPVGSAQKLTFDVQHGDVIIMGTDGLLDNVFNTRASKLVWDAKARGATPGVAAQQLATFASARARDPVYLSPFAKQARRAGFRYQGGKVDDITVVVSYVTDPDEPAAPRTKLGPPPPPPRSGLDSPL